MIGLPGMNYKALDSWKALVGIQEEGVIGKGY